MYKNIKLIVAFAIALLSISHVDAQSFNEDKTNFANFMKRMYNASEYEGVKIVDDYDHQYLVSLLSLEKAKYQNPSQMNRVAQMKAQSQASTFLNGSTISLDTVIKTSERTDSTNQKSSIIETVETIKENAMGFSQGLELLTTFDNSDGKRMVFIYMRELKK
jgi:UDP-N-acetylmuramate-alanine ligase